MSVNLTNKNLNEDSNVWDDLNDETILQQLDKSFDENENTSLLRKDENYQGFDNNTGNTWIYPTNLPIRSYQFNITRAALFKNTLVVLPTGLGKTFIAAVVMYNIYRWYPLGKIIFMAPTKPLVAQQVEACRKIMGIPMSDTAELTGKQNKKQRREKWLSKRVFFATPQVVQSDINDGELEFPFNLIKLVVVDEAHRAKGRYAYTDVIQTFISRTQYFRVLALSATPGRRIEDVAEVIRNLYISHLEVRGENSIDVTNYTHKKIVKTINVPLGEELQEIRSEFINIIDPYVRYLIENDILSGNFSNMSRGWLIMEQKKFREMSMHQRHPNQANINQNFSICISLYHALELLERHGLRIFLNFFSDNSTSDENNGGNTEKFFVALNPTLKAFLLKLKSRVGYNPFFICDLSITDDQLEDLPRDLDFGHPKFSIAKKFLLQHFEKSKDSRAMVFCEYRESVLLLHRLLIQCRPLIRPRIFVGQGGTGYIRAVTQKEQIEVMKDFRSGRCNVLISTSVAEEGIDVGEVELIVCFDISTKNPTRFIQRIGRTGRKKEGTVVMLATEGKEYAVLKEVMATKDKTNQKITKSREVLNMLYKNSPRLVPPEFNPKCVEKLMIINEEKELQQKKGKVANKKVEKVKNGKKEKKQPPFTCGTDVRKFFKKVSLDDEERAIFATVKEVTVSLKESPEVMLNFQDSDCSIKMESSSISKVSNKNILDKLCKEINIRGKQLDKLPSLKPFSLDYILSSKILDQKAKKIILERNSSLVREKFEALKAIETLNMNEIDGNDEIIQVKKQCVEIENIFGSRFELESFFSDNRKNKTNANDRLENKFSSLFKGFEKRPFTSSVDNFIKNKLTELNLENIINNADSTTSTNFSAIYDDGKDYTAQCEQTQERLDSDNLNVLEGSFTENFDFIENDSKYASQWTQNKIKNQSTPLIKPKRKSYTYLCEESPLLKSYATENEKSFISKSNCNTGMNKSSSEEEFNGFEVSEKLFEDDNFDDFELFNCPDNQIEEHSRNNNLIDSSSKHIEVTQISKLEDENAYTKLRNVNNTKNISEEKIAVRNSLENEINGIENNFFDDEFDEILTCNRKIFTQVESMKPSSIKEDSNVGVEEILDIISEKEKIDKFNVTNPELENFDLNDFLEPFDSDDKNNSDVVMPSQHCIDLEKANNFFKDFNEKNNFQENVLEQSSLEDKDEQKENRTPVKNEIINRWVKKSPSLFRQKLNFGRLRLFSSAQEIIEKPSMNMNENDFVKELYNTSIEVSNRELVDEKNLYKDPTQSLLDETMIAGGVLKRRFRQVIHSSESEVENSPDHLINVARQYKKERRKLKKRRCVFVDDEAAVSGEDSSDNEEENGYDCNDGLSQFIVAEADVTEHTNVNMQAKYLESVRSPNMRRAAFKIPPQRQYMDMSKICSQPVIEESISAYKEDSFVVTDDEDVYDNEISQLCPLERAEAILKAKRKAKSNGGNCSAIMKSYKQKKWKKLAYVSEGSSDEDIR